MRKKRLSLATKRIHIDPQSGTAFSVNKGQIIRIIDVEGEQVADMFCYAKDDVNERLSSGHTTDYNGKIFLSKGDSLYSNQSNLMFTIVADLVGKHIMLYAPCSQEMFVKSYGAEKEHPNCLDNLVSELINYGIQGSDITIPLNIFMNIEISQQGDISIHSPLSKAGDYIELRAEMDMIVGITACSAGTCNNFNWSPIDVEIYS
jgi:hypothetical protein